VRKIISILVALGLVLSLSVMATPVSADVTAATVDVAPPCASTAATYNITFNITADLHSGTHSITIEFPDDTTVPASFATGDITVEGLPVFGSEVTVDGRKVTFLVPEDIIAVTANPIVVFFTLAAGIINPSTAGKYNVYVNTSRAPDVTPVKSADYDISPAISEYEFVVYFGGTYAGIAEDFVPPFKACGQYGYGYHNMTTGANFTVFNLTLQTKGIPGCDVPCDNATVAFHLAKAPTGATVTLSINGTYFTPTVCEWYAVSNVTLSENFTAFWDLLLHVDTVGDYEICFNATCPTSPVCLPPGSEVIAEWCMPFHAYQWKDVYEIPLYRKWNLISLPLVPFVTDVDAMLAAYPGVAEVESIWHYDRCSDTWYVKGETNSFVTLTKIVDGKAYWVKVDYDNTATDPLMHAGALHGSLWVWGTAQPMPPDGPSAYEVCEGWNMVGFRSLVNLANSVYLWNFAFPGPVYQYGLIYGWWAPTQSWFTLVPGPAGADDLWPTEGYWIPFSVDGYIYP